MLKPTEVVRSPEEPFNKVLLETLRNVDTVLVEKGSSPLRVVENEIALVNNGKKLLSVTAVDIVVAGQSFQNTLADSSDAGAYKGGGQGITPFLQEIKNGLVRLNHLGISYFCGNLREEVARVKRIARENEIPLNEEEPEGSSQKWLFLGDTNPWNNSLCEVVLNGRNPIKGDLWVPHFQIDVDTSLSIEDIRKVTNKHLGNGFIKWELDIRDYGVVLVMGILGKVGNAKIALGIGTDIRDTEYHRKNLLKPVT